MKSAAACAAVIALPKLLRPDDGRHYVVATGSHVSPLVYYRGGGGKAAGPLLLTLDEADKVAMWWMRYVDDAENARRAWPPDAIAPTAAVVDWRTKRFERTYNLLPSQARVGDVATNIL